jgi:hypothetical protein
MAFVGSELAGPEDAGGVELDAAGDGALPPLMAQADVPNSDARARATATVGGQRVSMGSSLGGSDETVFAWRRQPDAGGRRFSFALSARRASRAGARRPG